jgi:hypothetical protein
VQCFALTSEAILKLLVDFNLGGCEFLQAGSKFVTVCCAVVLAGNSIQLLLGVLPFPGELRVAGFQLPAAAQILSACVEDDLRTQSQNEHQDQQNRHESNDNLLTPLFRLFLI